MKIVVHTANQVTVLRHNPIDIPELVHHTRMLTVLGNPAVPGSAVSACSLQLPLPTITRPPKFTGFESTTPEPTPCEPNHALVIHEFLVTASVPVRLFVRSLGIIAEGKIPPQLFQELSSESDLRS